MNEKESTKNTPKGYEIPIPKGKDFEDGLPKIAGNTIAES